MKKRMLLAAAALVAMAALSGCMTVTVDGQPCRVTEERNAIVELKGEEGVNVQVEAGSLRVDGRPGAQEVRVTGTACAGSRADLDRIQLTAERSSDGWIRVQSQTPGGNATLDLILEVPSDLKVMIRDESGSMLVRRLNRSLEIYDNSGDIEVYDVTGDVAIEDNSGTITVEKTGGNVEIRDDSGDIEVRTVSKNVTVRDSSGDIDVSDVGGNFTVASDGSGSVHHSSIRGTVSVPRK
ncbi:MAG TPA: DUF4097 family beta strand repeat-containing protein [Symbiobacteriaceae bacterium]|nr:DUF4097 family beta strand repeat-containing protein [Symbiobacteriaceae bacterium]